MKKNFWNSSMTRKDWGMVYLTATGIYVIFYGWWIFKLFKDEIVNWCSGKIKVIKNFLKK